MKIIPSRIRQYFFPKSQLPGGASLHLPNHHSDWTVTAKPHSYLWAIIGLLIEGLFLSQLSNLMAWVHSPNQTGLEMVVEFAIALALIGCIPLTFTGIVTLRISKPKFTLRVLIWSGLFVTINLALIGFILMFM